MGWAHGLICTKYQAVTLYNWKVLHQRASCCTVCFYFLCGVQSTIVCLFVLLFYPYSHFIVCPSWCTASKYPFVIIKHILPTNTRTVFFYIACDKRGIPSRPSSFEQYVTGYGWVHMECASGTRYSSAECSCSLVAHKKELPNSQYKYFVLVLRFLNTVVNKACKLHRNSKLFRNRIGGVMVSVLASSAVDHVFQPRSGQTEDYRIGMCCFSAHKHAALRRKIKVYLSLI